MTPDPVRQHLQSLPEPPLSDELWLRLSARHQRRANHRRVLRGAALALVLGVGAFWLAPWTPSGESGPSRTHPATTTSPDTSVQAIDRALQAAYARGASDEEVAPLWEIRQRMIVEQPASSTLPPLSATGEST